MITKIKTRLNIVFLISILGTEFILFGCNKKGQSVIINENYKVIGNFLNDSIFDGEVQFFDLKTNTLVKSFNYNNNVLNGKCTYYFPDKKISAISYYTNGLQNGYDSIFDNSGKLEKTDFYYYGLRAGGSINYKDGEIKVYNFLTFDNNLLFSLNYDSIKTKKRITDVMKEFFVFTKRPFSNRADNGEIFIGNEYFLYLPSPPRYRFNYSLVKITNEYKVVSKIQEFDTKIPWSKFSIMDTTLNANDYQYAIELKIYDTNSPDDVIMYKKLN